MSSGFQDALNSMRLDSIRRFFKRSSILISSSIISAHIFHPSLVLCLHYIPLCCLDIVKTDEMLSKMVIVPDPYVLSGYSAPTICKHTRAHLYFFFPIRNRIIRNLKEFTKLIHFDTGIDYIPLNQSFLFNRIQMCTRNKRLLHGRFCDLFYI